MRRLLIAVLLPLVLLAGCGGDETDNSSGESSGESSGGGDEAAAVDVDLCAELSAEQIGTAIGATVTTEVGPSGECEFDQEDPRALSGMIGTLALADLGGGYEVYRSGAESALTDAVTVDVPDVGEGGFVVVGTFGDGESPQGAGATQIGGTVVTVNLSAPPGTSTDDVSAAGAALLELAAGAL